MNQRPRPEGYFPWRHAFSCLTAGATLFLIFAGGMVTSTGSGLAVPDWPLSYGMFFPPMVGGIFYEHGHRMVAGTVGLLMAALAVWTWVEEPRRTVRRLAALALVAVALQALLGGLTVIFLLPTPVSVAHACLGQTFFCLTIALAITTGRRWLETSPSEPDHGLRWLTMASVAAVFVQLLLGALMRHTGAGLAIPDFPLAFGRLIPDITSGAIAIHFAHRLGALVVVTLVGFTAFRARRYDGLRRPAAALLALLPVQVLLGAATIWTAKAPVPTSFHVMTGAAILGTSTLVALRAWRELRPGPAPLPHLARPETA